MKKILMLVSAAVFAVTAQAATTEWGEYLDAPTGTYTTYTLPTSTGTITALWSFNITTEQHNNNRGFFYVGDSADPATRRLNFGYGASTGNQNLFYWGNAPYTTAQNSGFALETGKDYIAQIIIDTTDTVNGVKFSIKESGSAEFTDIVTVGYNAGIDTLKINGSRGNAYGPTLITSTSLIVTPEPTSLALLALGVAALGLKRKIR